MDYKIKFPETLKWSSARILIERAANKTGWKVKEKVVYRTDFSPGSVEERKFTGLIITTGRLSNVVMRTTSAYLPDSNLDEIELSSDYGTSGSAPDKKISEKLKSFTQRLYEEFKKIPN